jgi:hypothetical protein
MRKITSIIAAVMLVLAFASCGQKEKVDTSQAPQEIRDAIQKSYDLSKELTELQLKAGEDMVLDQEEIGEIGEAFRYLAIVNNQNAANYASDKYFIALRSDFKDAFDKLADTVVFLKDCEGYNELGLAIQEISLEVRDVTELPEIVPPEPADTLQGEEMPDDE